VGVVLSVAFNLITRMANGAAVHALDNFYGAMSRYAGVLSVDPLTQLAIYQQEQTQMLRTMTDEISGRFAANVNKAINEATKPMTAAFENFVTVSSQEQMRFLDRVVARFVDRMDASLSGQFGRLAAAMEKAAQEQDKSVRNIAQLTQDLAELEKTTDGMLSRMQDYVDALKRNQHTSDEVMEKMSATMETIDIVARQQTTHLKNVNTLQREVMAAMDEFRAASGAFMHQMHESGSRTAEGMHMAADELRTAGEDMARVQKEITGQVNADLKDAFDSFEQYMAEFTSRIDQVTQSVTGSMRELPRVIDETSDQFLDEMDRLTAALHQANERISRHNG
jgi:methyl-accepting chemotaxis protein